MHIEEFVAVLTVNRLTSEINYQTQGLGSLYSEMPVGERQATSKQIDLVNFFASVPPFKTFTDSLLIDFHGLSTGFCSARLRCENSAYPASSYCHSQSY